MIGSGRESATATRGWERAASSSGAELDAVDPRTPIRTRSPRTSHVQEGTVRLGRAVHTGAPDKLRVRSFDPVNRLQQHVHVACVHASVAIEVAHDAVALST